MLLATYLFDSDKELLDSLKSQLVTLDQDPTSSKHKVSPGVTVEPKGSDPGLA